jgi:AraC family transcriptional regulator of adaptative response/methylated-DNA-[protein]-cysteine methyltransferase
MSLIAEAPSQISRDPASDYTRIAKAIDFVRREAHRQPALAEVARAVHLSEFHLQRLFTRWAGLSPKRFVQLLTLNHAKQQLARSANVLSASLESGLSGSGRLHDLFINLEAVTPGEYKRGGAGLTLQYGFHPTPFGPCLLATTRRGICFLEFSSGESQQEMIARLTRAWPGSRLESAPAETGILVRQIFAPNPSRKDSLSLLVRGTNFQTRIWRALLNIPRGHVVSYARLAEWIGRPGASRAVGSAVGANPIAWLIPCHRVLRSDGQLGGYHWGTTRKAACLAWECGDPGPL